jgi:hypothetical protein
LLRGDIENNENSTASQKEDSLEAIDLLKEQFEVVSDLCRESLEFTSNDFAKYKQIIHEQFNAVLALERAHMHNGLAMYQHNWTLQQMAQFNQEHHAVAHLQQTLSNLTLRSGLMATERQAAEEKAILAHDNELRAQNQVAVLTKKRVEHEKHIAAIKSNLEEENQKSRALTSANLKIKDEHRGLKEDLDKLLQKYNFSVETLEQKESSLVSAKKTIVELQRQESQYLLTRQHETHQHASEVKSLNNRFVEYQKSVEVFPLTWSYDPS